MKLIEVQLLEGILASILGAFVVYMLDYSYRRITGKSGIYSIFKQIRVKLEQLENRIEMYNISSPDFEYQIKKLGEEIPDNKKQEIDFFYQNNKRDIIDFSEEWMSVAEMWADDVVALENYETSNIPDSVDGKLDTSSSVFEGNMPRSHSDEITSRQVPDIDIEYQFAGFEEDPSNDPHLFQKSWCLGAEIFTRSETEKTNHSQWRENLEQRKQYNINCVYLGRKALRDTHRKKLGELPPEEF
ncbi:hypothetical protein [Natrinema saccharevitans]|uniref:hypothetical protein n=1 Tax=Natrinema saccharevitans TaxID=301967 RepID=UPI0011154DB8|nr:hypothetical protein [Natrinema saccharevitans]